MIQVDKLTGTDQIFRAGCQGQIAGLCSVHQNKNDVRSYTVPYRLKSHLQRDLPLERP